MVKIKILNYLSFLLVICSTITLVVDNVKTNSKDFKTSMCDLPANESVLIHLSNTYDTLANIWNFPTSNLGSLDRIQSNADGCVSHLLLSGLELDGAIPDTIRALSELRELYLNNNNFSNTIPLWIGELTQLEKLFLGNNMGMTGGFPESIGSLIYLKDLRLHQNNLMGGELIDTLQNLTQLEIIDLTNANFTGPIPDWICTMNNLSIIDFSGNQFSGDLPLCIFNLTNIETLDISGNQNITGSLPDNMDNLMNLKYLDFDNNNFTGDIPSSLCSLENLIKVDFENNNLEGNLPLCLSDIDSAIYISFRNNRLVGDVPELCNMQNLRTLDLRENQIENLPNLTCVPWDAPPYGGGVVPGLLVENNKLTFEDIIPNMSISNSIVAFSYAPQDSISSPSFISLQQGESYTIDLNIDDTVSTNIYYWFRDGVFITSINSNEFSVNEAGTYTCQVTNPNAPDLILYSHPVIIEIVTYPFTVDIDTVCLSSSPVELNDYLLATGNGFWQGGEFFDTWSVPLNIPVSVVYETPGSSGPSMMDTLMLVVVNPPSIDPTSVNPIQEGNILTMCPTISNCSNCQYTWSGGNNPNSLYNHTDELGDYTLTITNSHGCSTENTFSIVEIPKTLVDTILYECGEDRIIETIGKGTSEDLATEEELFFDDPSTIERIIVETTYRCWDCLSLSDSIKFIAGNDTIIPLDPYPNNLKKIFRAVFDGSYSSVKLNASYVDTTCHHESLVAYVVREKSGGSSVLAYADRDLRVNESDTLNIPIGTSPVNRDIVVNVSISDLDSCGGNVFVQALAGGIIDVDTICGYDIYDTATLNIVELILDDVPFNANNIEVIIRTNQSIYVGGISATSDNCLDCSNLPMVDAGEDQIIDCSGSVNLDGSNSESGNNISYLWTGPNGFSSTLINTTVTEIGEYILTVTRTDGDCISSVSDTTMVSQDLTNAPNAGIAPSPIPICETDNQTIFLQTILQDEDPNGIWTETSIIPSTGTSFDAAASTFNTENQQVGTFTFTYTVLGNNFCPDDSEEVVIIIEETPTAVIEPSGVLDCINTSIDLDGSMSTGDTYSWTTLDGNIVMGINNAVATIDEAGTYTLTVSNSNSCVGVENMITVSEATDELMFTILSEGLLDCTNNALILKGPEDSNYTYQWLQDAIEIPTGTSFDLEISTPGEFSLVVTDATSGCTGEDQISVEIENDFFVPDTTVLLNCEGIQNIAHDWIYDDISILSFPPKSGNLIINDSDFEYTLPLDFFSDDITEFDFEIEIIKESCTTTFTLTIEINPCDPCGPNFYIPNTFFPTGNLNNIFTITALNDCTDLKEIPMDLIISNRWGAQVIFIKNFNEINKWNGSTDGSDNYLPEGTYYYLLQSVNRTDGISRKGYITILRN